MHHRVPLLYIVIAKFLICVATGRQLDKFLEADSLCPESKDSNISELKTYPSPLPKGTHSIPDRIFARELLLPSNLTQEASRGNGGSSAIQRVVLKLLRDDPVTIVALGGSVTRGHGVWDPSAYGWIAQFFSWIMETFPNAQHQLVNKAIPAVTSGYVSACVPELVPKDTDLVVLEFTYNDNVFGGSRCEAGNPARRGLERLLRRLLGHQSRPAIIYLHYWPPARFDPPFLNGEDTVDTLLKYYSVPTISMRDALYNHLAQNPALLDVLWKPSPDPKIHPTCLGARLMADLMIGFLWEAMLKTHVQEERPQVKQLKPFLLEGNWGHTATACALEATIQSLVKINQGWDWIDEGRTSRQHKWGFISTQPHDYLEIKVPTQRLPQLSHQFLVALGGLISYQQMGMMQLECFGGCFCLPTRHDMLHDQDFSMTGWRYLNVSKVTTEECVVRVTNLPETSSGGHKIKISSLLLSVGMETSSQPLYSDLSSQASTSTREPETFTQTGSAVDMDTPAALALRHRTASGRPGSRRKRGAHAHP